MQVQGDHYTDTFAPVVKLDSVRMLRWRLPHSLDGKLEFSISPLLTSTHHSKKLFSPDRHQA
jgi:hypothetical protein